MNISELKQNIQNGKFDKEFTMLYGDVVVAKERYIEAVDEFVNLYGDRNNIRLFSAPGRTEVGGNHTDHQHGRVLAGSVNLDIIAVVAQNDDNIVRIKSKGYNMDEVDVSDLDKKETEQGRARSLIRGVMAAFKNGGYNVGGFDAYTTSNVLKGSGLSSSAAFEVLVSNVVNGLYNDAKVDAVTMAKYSQFAECEYFGKPCGLLDQMASSVGGFTYADFCDPQNPIVDKISIDLNESDHTLCVVDTGGNHANLTQDYADITLECRAVSNALGVEFLRDASMDDFYKNYAQIRQQCGDRAMLRAMHFFNENERVLTQKSALRRGDFNTFFVTVKRSGESSYDLLQNVYSPSNPREQAISVALALTKQFLNGRGAYRVHGGGFAGTIQCYIPNKMFDDYKQMIESVFGEGSCVKLFVRAVGGYELKGE
ncbi:MAG: galactokinase [Ruminococcaceae bacterium]|nr:galactokinase [Oscillospiraceae bacterium]